MICWWNKCILSPPHKVGGPISKKDFHGRWGIYFFLEVGGGGGEEFMVGAGGLMTRSCQGKGHICIFQ